MNLLNFMLKFNCAFHFIHAFILMIVCKLQAEVQSDILFLYPHDRAHKVKFMSVVHVERFT